MKTPVIVLAVAACSLLLVPAFTGVSATKKSSASSNSSPSASKRVTVSAKSTKPEKMPAAQSGARKLVSDLTTTQKSKMLTLLNEGTTKDLSAIKGVSKTRGSAIEKARPYESIDEVILVKGIGKGTFSEIISHARSLTARRSSSSSASKKS